MTYRTLQGLCQPAYAQIDCTIAHQPVAYETYRFPYVRHTLAPHQPGCYCGCWSKPTRPK